MADSTTPIRIFTPRVYNKSKTPNVPDSVYVGRGSQWGNPFEIGVYSRGEVLDLHRIMIDYRIRMEPEYLDHLRDHLRGKNLMCYCKPLACHADYLLELANT